MLTTYVILACSSPVYIFMVFIRLYFSIILLREAGSPKRLAVKYLCFLDSVTSLPHIAWWAI